LFRFHVFALLARIVHARETSTASDQSMIVDGQIVFNVCVGFGCNLCYP
jgi:hypothetical protein